ncbi:MAG: Ribosomal large subunit pseudouridine synthase D (EC [uncultured Sulfurovum sp.]|uniref:Pseudouridine synthase n=1 Tax=uncultured Sulfurovum sp. TaxID=269237 RepID=A0A6S6SBT9_9BACT|nr:MAG: Ribosomal large subunit pseudouridine synthase D (EC [uncultured Sulfurovum sp.]
MNLESFEVTYTGRLDKVLTDVLAESRNQVEQLIKEGLVLVNGKTILKTGKKLSVGDKVEYRFKEIIPKKAVVIDFDVEIIYEDDVMMVVNKPSGLVVHPAPSVKEATLVDWLIHKGVSLSTISGEERHGIVHRIDKDTTGALVIAKTNEAHQKLSEQLQDKSMGRYYLALIDYPLKDSGIVEKPIGRNPNNRLKMDVVQNGKEAKSAFCKLSESTKKIELILVKLFTGRTHQIRVHLESLGRHILGDDLYGFKSKKDTIKRVYLHAYKLYLYHPTTGKEMEFLAPLFPDMQSYIDKEFKKGEVHEKINPNLINSYFSTITNRM